MSRQDEKMKRLSETARKATDRARGLNESAWPDRESHGRLMTVLAYTQLVIEGSDGDLVTDAAGSNLEATLAELINAPEQIAGESDTWTDRLLDSVARMPRSQGRDFEQAAKDAAKTFQRSAQRRLSTVEQETRTAKDEIESTKAELSTAHEEAQAEIDARLDEMRRAITEAESGFQESLRSYETTLESEREESIAQRGAQARSFEEAESERSARISEQLERAKADLDLLRAQSRRQIDTYVEEIQRMRDESAELVGVIGTIGTGERYGIEANEQKRVANIWRWFTVAFGLFAIGGVLAAILESHPAAETYAGKIALSVVLGGVATYAANQSKAHRDREKRARNLQLELTAFSPFIEPLTTDQQEEERVRMTRRTFGQIPADDDAPELGPSPMSLLMQRRKREEQEE